MGFMEQISSDIKNAMLAKEKEKLQALRDIKSKLLLEATSGNGEVSDDVAIKIIIIHDKLTKYLKFVKALL